MAVETEVRAKVDAHLSFDPLIPNAETVETMTAARSGDLVRVGSVDDLLAELHADD
jgi:DNA-damage-inducible protein J